MMHLPLLLLAAMSTLSQASDSWLRLRMAKSLDKVKRGKFVEVKVDDANLEMFTLRDVGTTTEKTYSFKPDTEIEVCEPVIDTKREQYVSIKQIETQYRSNSSVKTWFSRKTGGFYERDGVQYKKADLYFTMDENVRRGRPYGKHYRKFTEWLQNVMRARPRARNPVQQRRVANPARKKGCSVMGALEGLNRGLHTCGEKVKSFVNKHGIFGPPGLPMFPRGNASKKKGGAGNPPSSGDTRANRKDRRNKSMTEEEKRQHHIAVVNEENRCREEERVRLASAKTEMETQALRSPSNSRSRSLKLPKATSPSYSHMSPSYGPLESIPKGWLSYDRSYSTSSGFESTARTSPRGMTPNAIKGDPEVYYLDEEVKEEEGHSPQRYFSASW